MESFWDFLWYTIVVFVFAAYLIVLFQILIDLFRDHTVSGVAKAFWVVVLIVVPFFSALIYLVVRGQGMAIRAGQAQLAARQTTDEYIRQVTAGRSPAGQIADAKALLDSGAITPAEFAQLEAKAVGQNTAGQGTTGRDSMPRR
ncbi:MULTISPECIES: PLDc N-terminal domain-containing protein [Rhodococcus]|jgi:predicted PurR-regulated permease PerM|uniref:Cardiolipin synthase N-terminal domain-containing protein n=1 Tax=Rhodococcus aetherivorans TaxID=191292 RepID=A0ABQ0YQN5_9NOCA|nr:MULTISPECIES: PLDc N-terminal domain-containing protein [Rhodococcus]ETT27699.1 hypothetical protein RR21198_1616 [Rhodococcus rhodochrous ATCC 21198]AKE92786.1 membrane protein [Rhodococcus aetherivorans]MBC2589582.1 PLDc N-terminal domain-containing protein [Rhodococcus aetherivorans]MDV6295948.1 PLDc N-terminal domain-containing protein [Rhodococcus aetherivorans]NGP29745.1 SHOCT domain-containing protein [Rhodococcus aetherivorans]